MTQTVVKTANIRTAGGCRRECRSTWRYEHGGAQPGGPFPGTLGSQGDVRRCEHGRLWLFNRTRRDGFGNRHDEWTRLRWWLSPLRYRRAVAALGVTP